MKTQIVAALSLFVAASVAASAATPGMEAMRHFEDVTGVKLPEAPRSLRSQPLYTESDFNTAKQIVLEAARRMQMEHQSAQNHRRLSGWGFCLKFWDCPQGQSFSDISDKANEAASSAFSQLISELEKSGELDQLQSVIRQWSSFDTRFDLYTYIIAITNAIESGNWRQEYSKNEPLGRPSTKVHVLPPTAIQKACPSGTKDDDCIAFEDCGLAAPLQVPANDENFQDVTRASRLLSFGIAENLGFPLTADMCGEWNEGENPIEAIKTRLFGSFPEHRVMVRWGDDRNSDKALRDLIFEGLGQHRVQKVCKGVMLASPMCPFGEDVHAPADAKYAVYLQFADTLDVRPGFSKLGGDAYFDESTNVIGIRRFDQGRGKYEFYKPGDAYIPYQPRSRECKTETCWDLVGTGKWWNPFSWRWFSCEKCGPWKEEVKSRQSWEHVKMAFRGTLSGVVTLVDHLYALHLSVANAIVTANVQTLEPDHPIRRLLTPFSFRTAAINHRAAFALTNEFGLVHRGTPLTKQGIIDLFKFAKTSSAGLTWSNIQARKAAKGITSSDVVLPLDEDGKLYYAALVKYVDSYLSLYYPNGECASDDAMQRWMTKANALAPNHDLPTIDRKSVV